MKNGPAKVIGAALASLWLVSCGGPGISVQGKVVDSNGTPLSGASVKIQDTLSCCPGVDKPCVYTTDENGGWGFTLALGHIDDCKAIAAGCSYTVSMSGFSDTEGTFPLVGEGGCNEQTVSTSVTLIPAQ